MTGAVNFVTNYALVAQIVRLLLAPVVEPQENPCRMILLDLLAAARNGNSNLQRKTTGKCVRQHKRGILGALRRIRPS